jgi:hypothetical protein
MVVRKPNRNVGLTTMPPSSIWDVGTCAGENIPDGVQVQAKIIIKPQQVFSFR